MSRFSTNLLRRSLIAIALGATAAGCGTVMTAAPSGFLSDEAALTIVTPGTAATPRSPWPIDPSRATVAEVEWRAASGSEITAEERLALTSSFQAELTHQLTSLTASPNHARPVLLRAAITHVTPVSAALNTASALLLFVPFDRGGAAVEIEAIDAQTGRQLAAMRSGYFAPMTEMKARFGKLAPAEIALKKAAADFARLLQPA